MGSWKVWMQVPEEASQTFIVRSSLDETMSRPSGDHLAHLTQLVCSVRDEMNLVLCTAHTFTALSSEAVSNFWLSGLNWTLRTAACPAAAFNSVDSPFRSGTQSLTVESRAEEAMRLPVRENWTSKIGPVCPAYLYALESEDWNFQRMRLWSNEDETTCLPFGLKCEAVMASLWPLNCWKSWGSSSIASLKKCYQAI